MSDDVPTYRPVSTAAVSSLILGAASVMAFWWIWWLAVPLVGLIVGVAAWRKLVQPESPAVGLRLAQIGVGVNLAILAAGTTRHGIEYYHIVTSAQAVANEYLDNILANRLDKAFIAGVPPIHRYGLDDAAVIEKAKKGYNIFTDLPVVIYFSGKGPQAEVTPQGVTGMRWDGGLLIVSVAYRVRIDSTLFDVEILTEGSRAPNGQWSGLRWSVANSTVKGAS